ncbi:diguanylate cyclase/phosphodiesterase [Acidimicrobium ferrooxidans DSM 10331]|uniref:Diguanylate cyclase/phosphodiesterase n=1 Tax=Acidimicrobium ferrooxidans (strain DSM 10331 / JCM 15462 / NBRC 103882 / ICP) TaxID=525909 RepID=C7LZD1_ACIFD|nr:EAL domain-containing protein [Acidimicrobium ferrooxidans]ACU54089.1 diguanylate cyclase/phosphodiesterase [Acidimicrobium ferrooxidans DSM 10331]
MEPNVATSGAPHERTATAVVRRSIAGPPDRELVAALAALADAIEAIDSSTNPALVDAATRIGARLDYLGHRPSTLVALLAALAESLGRHTTADTAVMRALAIATDALFARRERELVRLSMLATRDPLTGLPNRRAFADALQRSWARAKRTGERVTVIALDLDDFKHVNDTYGHRRGDEVMAELAHRLAKAVRATDVVARTGGDEFGLVLDPTGEEAAVEPVLARLERELQRPLATLDGGRLLASAGIASSDALTMEADALLDAADQALYVAKHARPVENEVLRISYWQRTGTPTTGHRLAPPHPSEGISVVYQPIIDLATGRTVRAEALARTDASSAVHSVESLLQAATRAEHARLHRHIVALVLGDLAALGPDARVSVNVDAGVLDDQVLTTTLLHGLDQLAPGQLRIEITERDILLTAHGDVVRRLREHGATISLDDFGTGFASLSRLLTIPVDEIKLDRSVAADRQMGSVASAVLAIAVALGRALDIDLVVEGADSIERAAQFRAIGVPLAQGFAIGEPTASLRQALDTTIDLDTLDRSLVSRDVADARASMWEQAIACLLTAEPDGDLTTCVIAADLDEPRRRAHLEHHRIIAEILGRAGVIDLRRGAERVPSPSSARRGPS